VLISIFGFELDAFCCVGFEFIRFSDLEGLTIPRSRFEGERVGESDNDGKDEEDIIEKVDALSFNGVRWATASMDGEANSDTDSIAIFRFFGDEHVRGAKCTDLC